MCESVCEEGGVKCFYLWVIVSVEKFSVFGSVVGLNNW